MDEQPGPPERGKLLVENPATRLAHRGRLFREPAARLRCAQQLGQLALCKRCGQRWQRPKIQHTTPGRNLRPKRGLSTVVATTIIILSFEKTATDIGRPVEPKA